MKLARAFGAAVVLVTHGLSDFRAVGDERSEAARLAAALVADTASSALLAHGDAAIADTVAHLGLSGPKPNSSEGLSRHRFMARRRARRPRPPSRAEALLAAFDTDARMLADDTAIGRYAVLCTAGALVLGITLVITAVLGGASATVGLSGASSGDFNAR